jgi:hypothetical protein
MRAGDGEWPNRVGCGCYCEVALLLTPIMPQNDGKAPGRTRACTVSAGGLAMYGWFALAAIVLVLWVAAVVTHFIVSAAIHLLLGVAVALFIVGLVLGRRTAL